MNINQSSLSWISSSNQHGLPCMSLNISSACSKRSCVRPLNSCLQNSRNSCKVMYPSLSVSNRAIDARLFSFVHSSPSTHRVSWINWAFFINASVTHYSNWLATIFHSATFTHSYHLQSRLVLLLPLPCVMIWTKTPLPKWHHHLWHRIVEITALAWPTGSLRAF